jgi:hypothetical protein
MKTYRRQILIALFAVAASIILFQSVHVRAQRSSATADDAPAQDNALRVERDSSLADNQDKSLAVNKDNSPLINKDDAPTINAERRGNPYINFANGHAQPSVFTDATALSSALQNGNAQPRSLAAADFDEDGVPDLLSGYAVNNAGGFTLQRGNLDAIYPHTSEARQHRAAGQETNAAFLPEAKSFELPIAPDFIFAGDFDADGHFDVVAASRGLNALYWLEGDGAGGFDAPHKITLDGTITTMIAGEINRADGLIDLVVGINTAKGAHALVFESPDGALRGEPEMISLPTAATAFALGELDASYEHDLAIAAGDQLLIVPGRDRQLSATREVRSKAAKARIERRAVGFNINALAVGDFSDDARNELALLAADGSLHLLSQRESQAGEGTQGEFSESTQRKFSDNAQSKPSAKAQAAVWQLSETSVVLSPSASSNNTPAALLIAAKISTHTKTDLVMLDSSLRQLQLITNEATNEVATNTTADLNGSQTNAPASITAPASGLRVSASLDVTDAPAAAVLPMRLNDDALNDLVVLKHSANGKGTLSIVPTAALNTYTVINTSSNNTTGSFARALQQANTNPGLDRIEFDISGTPPHTIVIYGSDLPDITSPVVIDGTTQPGWTTGHPAIQMENSDGSSDGFRITSGSSTLKGLCFTNFTFYYGQTAIVLSSSNNIVAGNQIGIPIHNPFSSTLANAIGVKINNSANNLIGGTTIAERNLITQNGTGVLLNGSASGNVISGNYLGTDRTGAALADSFNSTGVEATGTTATNTIGGTTAGARNIISASDVYNISIHTASGLLVQGNYIGTQVNGTSTLPAGTLAGIEVQSGMNNTFGGTTPAARNVVAGTYNTQRGTPLGDGFVLANGGIGGTLIQGNYIGTQVNGTSALANNNGISLYLTDGDNDIVIGGMTAGARNIISGNQSDGLYISNNSALPNNVSVLNNYIGTDVSGAAAIPNAGNGLNVSSIGGGTFGASGAGNVISGNTLYGVNNYGANTLQSNLIGTNASGTSALPNQAGGVKAGYGTIVGGALGTTGNVISGNTGHGLTIANYSTEITIKGNLIGTNLAGNAAVPNTINGIYIHVDANQYTGYLVIGGTTAAERNVVSGNGVDGIRFDGRGLYNNTVQGNFIGTDINGTTAIGNNFNGLAITGGYQNNIIGGTASGARNIISGNTKNGIGIGVTDVNDWRILANLIGTQANATSPLGNGQNGILIITGAHDNQIGNGATNGANIIANNTLDGISHTGGTGHRFTFNSIHDNGGLAIDLGTDGVTPNDNLDPDTGANNLQNFPVLTSAVVNGSNTIVTGTLNSGSGDIFTIEFYASASCDASGNGEGTTPLGSTTVTTDANGNASINTTLTGVTAGQVVTATATDDQGNTSEFSACRIATAAATPGSLQFSAAAYSVNEGAGTATINVTRTGGSSGAVSVQYATSNGTAIFGSDYTATSGTLSWASGDAASKTFNITITNDAINEATETVNLSLSNPTGGATLGSPSAAVLSILDNDAPQSVNAGQVIISEFRFSGPGNNSNEFVELYNNTDTNIRVGSFDGTNGWSVFVSRVSEGGMAYEVCDIPVGTIIPARGHFLAAFSAFYTLASVAAADSPITLSMGENGAIALFKSQNVSAANRLDSVGYTAGTDPLFHEGTGLPGTEITNVAAGVEYSWVRKFSLANYPQDTNDNAADFVLVSTTGATLGGQPSVLGAPGPENTQSPVRRDTQLVASYTDPLTCGSCTPNRVRVGSGNSGTLAFRRHFTNQTGATVTRLRFRVIDITTFNSPVVGAPPQAQLRVTNSVNQSVSVTLGTVTVQGTTLELPSANPDGGLNASLTTTLPAGGLPNGQGLDVQFVTNVILNGRFRFFVGVEALP